VKATICRRFRFEAAHYLPSHEGKCKNLHGHSYKVEVAIRGPIQEEENHPEHGMVMDFSNLKNIFNYLVGDIFDHNYLNDQIDRVPTAENLAAWMFESFEKALPEFEVVSIRVYETEDSYAEVTKEDFAEGKAKTKETSELLSDIASALWHLVAELGRLSRR
jgi:6-pyruvoyltetrahydropterin/6-carboxytetrahydropterin synthase